MNDKPRWEPPVEPTPEIKEFKHTDVGRPPDFDRLSAEEQWEIDKKLGILDWDGN